MKSLHQYSNEKAPVILVATHSENKTPKEKMVFFREIWKTLELKDKSLHRHLQLKRQFSIGFHDNESIGQIKQSIVDVVQNLDHWGEELPRSWVMFEKFFQEKKSQRIIKKKSLLAFNDSLPEGIKLQTVDDIHVMLQFFHDLKEILYFNQNLLGNVIIVDVQWFADAFKNVITDKNHAEEDLFEFASDWDKFDETGELNDTLLSAIWKMNNNGYLEQKEDIMLYMEKLGLLAKMDNTKWYVPCMNKKQFPKNRFTSYPSSSILCYAFNVLPAGIYQRLIASCLQIPWKPASSRDGPFIYQTAAVFLFEKHNILLGMTPTEIQLQVFNTEGEVDVSTCLAVKKEIDNMLSILSRTFQADFKFQLAFKCKASGFVDGQESSVINEDEFSGSGFQCLSCPEEKMHFINTEDIIKYWKEECQLEGKGHEETGSNPSLEQILNAVSRKIQGIGISLLEGLFEVNLDVSPTLSFEEKVFRILYQWKSKNAHLDHLRELEKILQREGQGQAAEYMRTFDITDVDCSDVASPDQTVSSAEFKLLSEYLPKDFPHFVRFLGLPQRYIEQMEADGLKIQDKIYKSLTMIQEKCHCMLNRKRICNALTFIERNDVIVELGWISRKRKRDD